MVKSEAEGPKLREGVRERRNWSPEFYEEQRVPEWEESGLGEGKSLVKGELWLSGEGRGGPKMCLQGAPPSHPSLPPTCYKIKTSHVWRSLFTQVEWNETVVSIRAEEVLNGCTSAQEVLEPWSDSLSQGPCPVNCKLESEHCSLYPSLHQWICHEKVKKKKTQTKKHKVKHITVKFEPY